MRVKGKGNMNIQEFFDRIESQGVRNANEIAAELTRQAQQAEDYAICYLDGVETAEMDNRSGRGWDNEALNNPYSGYHHKEENGLIMTHAWKLGYRRRMNEIIAGL